MSNDGPSLIYFDMHLYNGGNHLLSTPKNHDNQTNWCTISWLVQKWLKLLNFSVQYEEKKLIKHKTTMMDLWINLFFTALLLLFVYCLNFFVCASLVCLFMSYLRQTKLFWMDHICVYSLPDRKVTVCKLILKRSRPFTFVLLFFLFVVAYR